MTGPGPRGRYNLKPKPGQQIVKIPYKPRALQREIHANLNNNRFGVIVCHRRFGKTVLAINHLIRGCCTLKRERPRFAYLAPYYKQAKRICWDYLKHFTSGIPGAKPNESELRVDMPGGGRVSLHGCDNPDALKGIYLDGVVLDEYAQMPPSLWGEVIRPTLSDRAGWGLFLGTPKGRNAFFHLYQGANKPGWFRAMYKASETGILPASELSDAAASMSADEYAQEYECSWEAAIKGAYYATELERCRDAGRVLNIPVESVPVNTFWDLGIGDSTAIWLAQAVGREARIVGYYENSGEGLQHYINWLHDWRDSVGATYGQHFAPHDIEVRELTTGRSRLETARKLGISFQVVPNMSLEDGIEAARQFIGRCWFDAEACEQGLFALQNYHKAYDDKLQTFKDRPLHDWSSHGSDAFRYMAIAFDRVLSTNDFCRLNDIRVSIV